MIAVKNLSFDYGIADTPVLQRVNVEINSGEVVLLCGPTGSGKSTFLKTINGLAPTFTGGRLQGLVELEGVAITGKLPHELSELLGYVNQQPEGAFATDTVEEELAFGMEQLGFTEQDMLERIRLTSTRFNLDHLLNVPLTAISSGQQQKVSIGSVLAAGQTVLLLDEPTSALDEISAVQLLETLRYLATSNNVTVLIAEHRIDRVLPFVDSIFEFEIGGKVTKFAPEDFGVTPMLPQSIEKHIKLASDLVFEATALSERFESGFILGPIDIELESGRITVITGANGSGKTSLLWRIYRESVLKGLDAVMVPQNATDLLILKSISDELRAADPSGPGALLSASKVFEDLVGRIDPALHPRDLSAGQQLSLALAIQITRDAPLLLLDEPTRGLDIQARQNLAHILAELRNNGRSILLATHDIEFAELIADKTLRLAAGQIHDEKSADEF